MKKTKKALASLAIAGMVLSMAPMSVFAADSATNRIFGADRVQTAVEVAKKGWTTATTAIVAPAEDEHLVDALAAAPLAGAKNAPILLVEGNMLTTATTDELKALGVKDVYVVGAVDAGVVTQLSAAGYNATAVKGASRMDTAAEIAKLLSAPKGSFVVGYDAIPDALSVASFAAANNYQILVANVDGTLPANEMVAGTSYVLGGPTLVKDIAGAKRVFGNDRYDTNKAILSELSYSYDKVYVANGEDSHLVDSLVASGLAGQTKSPIALTDNMAVKAAADLGAKMGSASQTIALGGPTVVADTVRDSVKYVAPATLAVESVTAPNGVQLAVKFTQAVDESIAENVNNYVIADEDGNAVTLDSVAASLNTDTNTVTITLPSSYAVENDETKTYVVTVKAIQAKDDVSEKTDVYSTTVVVKDETAPTVTAIKSVTNDDSADYVEITFSEPIASGSIKIDGSSEGSAKTVFLDPTKGTSKKVKITDLDLSADETHTLQVINLQDYSGNFEASITKDFKVTVDNTAPTVVSVKAIGDSQIEVKFSEEVDVESVQDGITVKNEAYEDLVATVDDGNDDGDVYVVTVNEPTLFDDKDTRTLTLVFNGVIDTASNEIEEDTVKTVKVSIDEDAPTLASLSYKKDGNEVVQLVATFSENVTGSATAYPTVIDPDGVVVSNFFSGATYDDNKVTYAVRTPADLDGKYTFRFTKGLVTDLAADANDLALVSKVVDFGDGSSDKISADGIVVDNTATLSSGLNKNILTVDFGTPVKGGAVDGSATNGANYTLDGVSLDGAYIFLDETKSVATIEVPAGTVSENGSVALTIRNVKDSDGDVFATKTILVDGDIVTDNTRPVLTGAQVISNTLILTFNEAMTATGLTASIFDNSLEVKVGTKTLEAADFTSVSSEGVAGSTKKILIKLTPATDSDWNSSKTITVKTLSGSSITDSEGNNMKSGVSVTAE